MHILRLQENFPLNTKEANFSIFENVKHFGLISKLNEVINVSTDDSKLFFNFIGIEFKSVRFVALEYRIYQI